MLSNIVSRAPGKGTGKCKYDLVWGRKEALDRLTSTTRPLAGVTLSWSPPLLYPFFLTSHFQIPPLSYPYPAPCFKGYIWRICSKDNTWVCSTIKPNLTSLKGECCELDSEKVFPVPCSRTFTTEMSLVCCFGKASRGLSLKLRWNLMTPTYY